MPCEWMNTFIGELRKVPNVAGACRAAGISRTLAYKVRGIDPEFASDWDDAIEESVDELVGECYRRAHQGTEKPVFYMGLECGTVREYSDSLAIFLLKAHRRGTYGDKVQAEHSGPGGGPIPLSIDVAKLTDEQLRAIAAGEGGGRA